MRVRLVLGLVAAVAALTLSTGMVGATPIDFTGDLAPVIEQDDVIGTAMNWIAAFSTLVLFGMGLRYAPKIVRAMRRMAG